VLRHGLLGLTPSFAPNWAVDLFHAFTLTFGKYPTQPGKLGFVHPKHLKRCEKLGGAQRLPV
jgi:hypothetical protein